ncbi:MAG: tetratricopeptide repeat protein [Bacteroidia bacterium]|nr:tetratricopeptide repeat protein [Bacteroidia bacterium]MDW8159512.1 tetratricopeptide repeat protein [Bacteroidia bacterium]
MSAPKYRSHSPKSSTQTNLSQKSSLVQPLDNPQSKKPSVWNYTFWLQALAVFLIGVGVYIKSWQNEYAVDDSFVIVENIHTQAGFAGIPKLLFRDSMDGWQQEGSKSAVNYYRPLALITFAIEKGIQGKNNPHVSHIINTLLYGLLLVLLLYLLCLYFKPKQFFLTLGTVLIFAVHPIHTEVVANIKSRDEILAFLFSILTLISLFKSSEKKSPISFYHLITLIFYFLALLSKENSVTLLAIAPLTLYFFKNQPPKKAIISCWPLLIVFLGYLALRIGIIGFNLKLSKPDPISNRFYEVDFLTKYATISYILLFYIRLLFLPHPLSWDYSFKEIDLQSFSQPLPIFSLLLHVGIFFYLWQCLPGKKLIAFALAFYLITLSLVSNLIIDIGGFVGERFLFQPSLGFCLGVAIALSWLQQKFTEIKLTQVAFLLPLFLLVSISALAGYKTYLRSQEWKNNETLFIRDVEAAPRSAQANMACGSSCISRAKQITETEQKKYWLRKAIYHSEIALKIFPWYAEPLYNIGMAYTLLGDTAAFRYFRKLVQLAPNYPPNQFIPKHESSLYLMLGNQHWQKQNIMQAKEYYQIAVKKAPENYAAWYHLGLCYEAEKKYEQALASLENAVSLYPNEATFWYALGVMAINANQKEKARQAWQKTLSLAPNHEAAKRNLELINQ